MEVSKNYTQCFMLYAKIKFMILDLITLNTDFLFLFYFNTAKKYCSIYKMRFQYIEFRNEAVNKNHKKSPEFI